MGLLSGTCLVLFHFLLCFSGRFLPRGDKDNHQHTPPPICLSTSQTASGVRYLFLESYNKNSLEILPYLSFNQRSSWESNTMARKKLFSEWPDLVMDLPLEPLRRVPGRQPKGGEGENRMTKNAYPWSEGRVVSDQARRGDRSHIMHSLPC